MTSRRISTAAAALSGLGMLVACGPASSEDVSSAEDDANDDQSLTVFISGDTNVVELWEDGIIPAYQEANPDVTIETTHDLHGEHDQQTVARLVTATEAGDDPGYDLIDAGFVTSSAAEANTLLEVGPEEVEGLADVPETTVSQGRGYGIPYRASSVLLAYDTGTVEEPPETLEELLSWIEDNPGEFAYNSPSTGGSGGAFVTTVLDSYLSDEEQESLREDYDEDAELPSGWDEGFERLAELGPSVYQGGVYPNGNNQVLELLGSGEISMAPVWSDQFLNGQQTGLIPETVDYAQISDPSFTGSASYLGVPLTSGKQESAIDVVNFVLSPEGQALIAEQISGYPVIDLDLLPEDVAEQFESADPEALRPGYVNEVGAEQDNMWDQRVP